MNLRSWMSSTVGVIRPAEQLELFALELQSSKEE